MKKMMTSFLLISLILLSIFSVPIAATTMPIQTSVSRSDRLERRQAIIDLRIKMLEKQLTCLKLAQDNTTLRIELRELLLENRESLTPAVIETLKAANQEIKALADQLRETRGDIRSLLDALHDGTPPTLDEIESTYDQISDILDHRFDLLNQINERLSFMIEQITDQVL